VTTTPTVLHAELQIRFHCRSWRDWWRGETCKNRKV